jgi:DNA-directed RNA polymerase specialized sigma24 family protein
VTRLDSDGSELMIVWGAGGTPHHDDGTPVVTPRLYAKLTPLEIDLYSGDSLRAHLAKRVAYRTNGEPIDGWAPEDFVSFGLIEASKYGWYTRSAVVTWVHRKIDSVRRRADARHVEPLYPEGAEPIIDLEEGVYMPTVLPDDLREWVEDRLSDRMARSVLLFAERGLTPTEAAGTVGINVRTFYEALTALRKDME